MKKIWTSALAAAVMSGLLYTGAMAAEADGAVIFEKDGIKVTTAGLDQDPTSSDEQPVIWLDIENAGEKDVRLGVADGCVDDLMTDIYLIDYFVEDGEYYGSNQDSSLTIPAESSGRYAIGYYRNNLPGINQKHFGELEFCFTLAEDEYTWPDYFSDPVSIKSSEDVEAVDISSLGTVLIDNEDLLLVAGDQDYDSWAGPLVYLYAENKSDKYIGISADTAEADGNSSDYIYYYNTIAPGRYSAGSMSFDTDISTMKGFENLTLTFKLCMADTSDALNLDESKILGPVSIKYPPQEWGEFENDGLKLEIEPKYYKLVTVELPEDEEGVLFSVSETASLNAGKHEGAGWLFSIGKVDEDKLHEMLCYDMSHARVFAKDEEGNYYIFYHPTDVRYERSSVEEMERDQDQWSMLCEWADSYPDTFTSLNALDYAAFGNTEIEMAAARAAYLDDVNATLSTTEFGPIEIKGVDGSPYVGQLLQAWYYMSDEEAPDGEYIVLNFPDEDLRVDFFFAPGGYARVVSGDRETLYQAGVYDSNMSDAELLKGWYYALAKEAGLKSADDSFDDFCGNWHEKIAGRGSLTISQSLAPGKVRIQVSWPESAAVEDCWDLIASLTEEGRLAYENGSFISTEYSEDGSSWENDNAWDLYGELYLNDDGELIWKDSKAGESVFVRY